MFELVVILALILLNGLFSMSEMAIVSARKNRLEQKAGDGDKGAAKALELAENPNKFLSTVQIGITLIGILNGAFGGATIAGQIGERLAHVPVLARYSEGIGVAVVVLAVTYFSLVLGELVPKRIALNSPERLAGTVAPLMGFLSRLTTPLVALFSASTNFFLRVFGFRPSSEPEVTEEDVKSMLTQGAESGVFMESEQDMVERIFRLGDRSASSLMTPRMDIACLDVQDTPEQNLQTLRENPFSRFPVCDGSIDNVIGFVRARDLLFQLTAGQALDIQAVMTAPLFMPETAGAIKVLEKFKQTGAELAVVIDEYGGVLGLVSMTDLLEAIVGEVTSPNGGEDPEAVRREDGSWLFDGMIQIDDLKDHLEIDHLPDEEDGNYETLSGLVMTELGRVPVTGDSFVLYDLRFEVVDMDGRRVDKVLVEKAQSL